MKKLTYIIFITAIWFVGNIKVAAQVVNRGTKLFVGQSALLYVDAKYTHQQGTILNNGQMVMGADWENNATAFDLNSSGSVKFTAKHAVLSGANATYFPGLFFIGQGVFELKSDITARLLNLGDAEIQVKDSRLTLDNDNPSVLYRNKGFINTSGTGLLVRKMQNNQSYLFPLGSSKLGLMRFVSLNAKDANMMGVSMLDKDPTMDGYSRISKGSEVTDVNDNYYYIIKNLSGNGYVDANFYTSSNENYNDLANWTNKNLWDKVAPVNIQDNIAFAPGLNKMFSHEGLRALLNVEMPFALANITSVNQLAFYNAFSPDGDGKNDTWEIKNIDMYPDNDLKIYDRSGNLVYRASGYNSTKYWDGQNVSSGTYIYILRVKIGSADKYYKGAITMVKN